MEAPQDARSERDVPLVGAALWAAKRAFESSPNEYLFLVIVLMMGASQATLAMH